MLLPFIKQRKIGVVLGEGECISRREEPLAANGVATVVKHDGGDSRQLAHVDEVVRHHPLQAVPVVLHRVLGVLDAVAPQSLVHVVAGLLHAVNAIYFYLPLMVTFSCYVRDKKNINK